MVQHSEFVRWSSAFHHVLVFAVKKRCALFTDIAEYTFKIETFLCQNIFPCLPGIIRPCNQNILCLDMLNNSAIWLVNMKPRNKQMPRRILLRRTRNPCDYTMKISSRFYRLLVYDVKITTNIDGMGPF